MAAQVDRFELVEIDDIIVDRFQVRTTNVGEGIDELASSIDEYGLLHPIIVCRSQRDDEKWEVVCGQRRLLAHKKLQRDRIQTGIIDRVLSPEEGEAVSANENVHQLTMSRPDLVDLCERLFMRYGSMQAVAEKTKIPYHVVRKYVRWARLDDDLKEMVQNREIETDLAIKVQDAVSGSGVFDKDEALELIDVLKRSDNDLRKRILNVKKKSPNLSVKEAEEKAEEPPEDVKVTFTLYDIYAHSIRRLAEQKGSDTNTAAADLVEDALDSLGISDEES